VSRKHTGGHEIQDEPIPRHVLEDPEVQAAIEDALDRVRRRDTGPGLTPEQLEAMADEELRKLERRPGI
jgi:hypothetical protein